MENSEFKPVKLRLKIDFVSYTARGEGLVNMVKQINQTNEKNLSIKLPIWSWYVFKERNQPKLNYESIMKYNKTGNF